MVSRTGVTSRLLVAFAVLVPVLVSLRPAPAEALSRLPARIAGADRYATAVALSQVAYPSSAPAVVVASGETFADGLVAGPLAARLGGPVLLTARDALPDVVAAELRRLGPGAVIVMGGTSAVSPAVADAVGAAAGQAPTRIGGADRYGTAALAAAAVPEGAAVVFVATGADFADALAGAAAAAAADTSVLLVPRQGVPTAVAQQLGRIGPAQLLVLGGAAAVSDDVVAALAPYSPSVVRLAGPDRFATAAAVAAGRYPTVTQTVLAAGLDFPDALAAGPLAALRGAPVLLSRPTCAPSPTIVALQRFGWPDVTAVGGPAALTADALAAVPCSPVADGTIAPGVHLVTHHLPGPVVAKVLTVDRGQGWAIRSTTATGDLTGRLPTSVIARRWGAVAAVNGDFFFPDGSPLHAFATGGRVLRSPGLIEDMVGFDELSLTSLYLGTPSIKVEVTDAGTGATMTVDRVNDGVPDTGQMALYTKEGAGAADPEAGGCAVRLGAQGPAVLAPGGDATTSYIVAANATCGPDPGPAGDTDLLVAPALGAKAPFVSSLATGDEVALSWHMHPDWPHLLDATGSNTTLVRAGAVSADITFATGSYYQERAPRTAVGRLADGRMVLVAVDGRQPGHSVGMTPAEMADFLTAIEVSEATMLDGGGSTAAAVLGVVANRPSDPGGERPVGTALVVVPAGTPDPPPWGTPPPAVAAAAGTDVVGDSASLGGWSSARAASGAPVPAAVAGAAEAYRAAGNPH
ncbi:MAG: cell wall-binding repeat-containing protein [Acidimicrobiia bacterium]